jgi:hypothetical protein
VLALEESDGDLQTTIEKISEGECPLGAIVLRVQPAVPPTASLALTEPYLTNSS